MKKFFRLIIYTLLFFLPIINNVHASCPTIYHDGEETIAKNKNKWLILTKENILDVCTNLHNIDDTRPDETFLNCSNRGITKIDAHAFSALVTVKKIDLSCNYLTGIGIWIFNNLSWLKELDLSENNISILSKLSFRGLNNLENLDLYNNQINKIQFWTFAELKNLIFLNIYNNQINKISSWTFNWLEHLTRLSLYGNPLKSIESSAFENLKNLSDLSITLPYKKLRLFEWMNNIYHLTIDFNNEDPDDINIYKWFFSWLENLWSLSFSKKTKINSIEPWSFSNLNKLTHLSLPSVSEIKSWAFTNLNNLEWLHLWTSGNISDGVFNWLNSLKQLNLYVNGNIWNNSFIPLKNLRSLNLNISHKNNISKNLFSNMKNLEHIEMSVDDWKIKQENINSIWDIILKAQTILFYNSLGILNIIDHEVYSAYTNFKYILIWVIILIFILVIINRFLKKRRGIWIMCSYSTMRKYSKYLSSTKKRRWHILTKIILRLVFLAPLLLGSFIVLKELDDSKTFIFYQTTDNLKNRYTDDIVSKGSLVYEWEAPCYWHIGKFFRQDNFNNFDLYHTWCSNSRNIEKLKALEEKIWKTYYYGFSIKMDYETLLENMEDNNKCFKEHRNYLLYSPWNDSTYTYVWKITFLSILVTIGYWLTIIVVAFIIWWILRYILMFLFYNTVLFFIKWFPWNEIINELKEIGILDNELIKN